MKRSCCVIASFLRTSDSWIVTVTTMQYGNVSINNCNTNYVKFGILIIIENVEDTVEIIFL